MTDLKRVYVQVCGFMAVISAPWVQLEVWHPVQPWFMTCWNLACSGMSRSDRSQMARKFSQTACLYGLIPHVERPRG